MAWEDYRIFDHAKIIKMSKTGMNGYAIAKQLGCSKSLVYRILKRAGIFKPRIKPAIAKAMARQFKQRGYTYRQIGDSMGVSRQRAQQLLAPTPDERKELLARANGRCERCGKESPTLHGHHKDYLGMPDEMLCPSCHIRSHRK